MISHLKVLVWAECQVPFWRLPTPFPQGGLATPAATAPATPSGSLLAECHLHSTVYIFVWPLRPALHWELPEGGDLVHHWATASSCPTHCCLGPLQTPLSWSSCPQMPSLQFPPPIALQSECHRLPSACPTPGPGVSAPVYTQGPVYFIVTAAM